MTERIGLEAALLVDDFSAGVKIYNSGVDAMEASNQELVSSSSSVGDAISSVGKSIADGAKNIGSLVATKPREFFDRAKEGISGMASALNNALPSLESIENAYLEIKDAVGEAIELAELGSQAERAEERFRAFAGEIGDADELLEAFQRGAGGTVDKLTAMTSAGRLLQMGLVQNNDEMEQVTEMAIRLGDQTQSAGDRIADFAALLANQSIPRLDNFGISSGKVRTRIEELQKAFPGMSREVAFSKAVFEEGGVALDILGERTVDAGTKMEVARANIQNMRIEMGQRLLPVVASLFGVIADLNTNTLALIAVLGSGAGAAIKFAGGLGGLAEKLGASTLQMGALAAAAVGLVVAVEGLQDQINDMNAAQDSAQEAAATLGDQVQALVDDGMSLSDAMAQVGLKVNEATDEFNNATVLGVIPLKNALNAGAEFTKTMTEATGSLQSALVANVETFPEYVAQVIAYNNGLTDGAAKLTILSEAEFDMAQIRAEGASAASLQADAILQARLAVEDSTQATERSFPSIDKYNQNQARAASRAEQMASAVANSSQQIQASSGVLDASAAAIEARAAIEEKAARIEDMQATSALAAAAALEAKRQKDIETVQAEQALAQSVLDASDAMIAQTFISGLDPEQMGLTAYREAVEDIQLAFGLATPESIALARGINQGVDAINEGQVARDQYSEFISAIIDDSKDATSSFDTLSNEFASNARQNELLAERMAQTGDEMLNNIAAAEELINVEEGLDATTNAVGDTMAELSDLTARVATGNELWTDRITDTQHALDETQATTEQWTQKMQGLDNRLAATGEELLSTEDKVQALNSSLERTGQSGTQASGGLDEVETSAGETAAALEEATAKTNELDSAMADTAGAAPGYGAAIGSGLRSGMEPQMDGFVASFRAKLQTLKDQLPSSEPKDPTSPLYGLGRSGEAIIGNMTAGMVSAAPDAVNAMADIGEDMGSALASAIGDSTEDLFSAAGVLGGLGGAAAGILQRRTVDPLQARFDDLTESIEGTQQAIEETRAARIELQEPFGADLFDLLRRLETDPTGLRLALGQERFAQLVQIVQLRREENALAGDLLQMRERQAVVGDELTEQQERLLRLQQQQENLRFLQQQAELLELIAEKGLNAEEILGGLTLGLDANIEDVIDAMAAAMEQVIAQAEEELGIASPSKVFEQIGRETMAGMAVGIEKLMGLPVAQSAIATQAMIAAPAAIASPRNTTIDNSRTMGDVNIQGGVAGGPMSQGQLVATIRRVMREEIRGT